jgi:hypothetical protein
MPSSNLSRNTSGTGTSNQRFTMSLWVKKSSTDSAVRRLIELYNASTHYVSFRFRDDSSSRLDFYSESNGASVNLRTNRSFRDLSAWYHLVLSVDTTLATADDRMKMYVNGVQETSFALRTNPSLNENLNFNNSGNGQYIARAVGTETDRMFDGSMTHVHFIDGTAYDASTFGETDTATGIWKPKTTPSVTYGTNGFFLKFENSASFGTDSSPNGNNFTVNGTITQTIDTPSNVFCTLNPLIPISSVPTFSNGNLRAVSSTAEWRQSGSTLGISAGKWYWEAKGVSGADWNGGIGIKKSSIASESNNYNYPTGYNDGAYSYMKGGNEYYNGSSSTSGFTSYAVTDVVGIALDLTNNFIYYHKNGVWQNSGVPTSGATGTGGRAVTSGETWLPFVTTHAGGFDMNFGNGFFGTTAVSSAQSPSDGIGIFEYEVPTGYKALCTKSINAQEYS